VTDRGLEKWHSSFGGHCAAMGNNRLFSYCCFECTRSLRIYRNSWFRKYAQFFEKDSDKKLRLVVKYMIEV